MEVSHDSQTTQGTEEPITLNLKPGETATYRLRLTERPINLNREGNPVCDPPDSCASGGWWVMIRVNVSRDADDTYAGYSFVPSVGWEFNHAEPQAAAETIKRFGRTI